MSMRADGPSGPDRPDLHDPDRHGQDDPSDRAGPKRAPGPVTGEFGRIGFSRRMSMTRPSSWRNAAWLIVATASVVLLVLVHGAVRLAGPNGRSGQVDAFPGLPTGGLLTPQPPRTNTLPLPYPPSQGEDQNTSAPATQAGGTGMQTSLEAPGGEQTDARTPASDAGTSTGGPPPSTGRPTSAPNQNGDQDQDGDVDVMDATDRFFGLLPENTDAAWLMMDPEDQQMSFGDFNRMWRRYADVELLDDTVGADPMTVIASVKVTERSGVSATQRWKLTYQGGGNLVICELVQLDPAATGLPVNTP